MCEGFHNSLQYQWAWSATKCYKRFVPPHPSPIGFEVKWHTSQSNRNSHNWWRIFSISSGNMQTNALVMPAILPPSPVLKSRLTSSWKRTINRCSFSISRKKCKFVYVKCSMKKVIFFLMTPTHRRNSWNHLLHNNHQVSQTRPIQPKQIAILHPPIRFSQWIRLYEKYKQKRSWKKKGMFNWVCMI